MASIRDRGFEAGSIGSAGTFRKNGEFLATNAAAAIGKERASSVAVTTMKPKSQPPRDVVALSDLVPIGDVKGGAGKRVFGAGGPAPTKSPAARSTPKSGKVRK
jgi:hypothetical protein